MSEGNVRSRNDENVIGQILGRFIAAAVVLAGTAFFTPGFTISSIWALALAAVVLTAIDYLITKITGLDAKPFGKGITGFILAVAVLYLTKFLVAGYSITLLAAVIGALIYGVIDYILPGRSM